MTGTGDADSGVGASAADANVREVVWTMLGGQRPRLVARVVVGLK